MSLHAKNNFWNQKNILVTGASGLLGPWLIEELLAQNGRIVALVRDRVPDSRLFATSLQKRVTLVWGEIENMSLMQRILNEFEINTVFHLGAQAIVSTANRSPLSTFKSNIQGTWTLLEACRQSPWVERIIVASSDKAYGQHETLPYTENAALQGRHPYDVSKSCADLIAQSYFHTYNLPVCVTRCGNFFGGGDLHFNRIIPGTIKLLVENKRPIIRSNGLFIRDYIYVKDVVSAYMTLAENMKEKNLEGQCFNFSTDKPLNVIELVNLVATMMNAQHLEPIIENQANNEIPAQHLSSQKARQLLGWQAIYGIEKGLEETIAWYKDYLGSNHEKTFNCCSLL